MPLGRDCRSAAGSHALHAASGAEGVSWPRKLPARPDHASRRDHLCRAAPPSQRGHLGDRAPVRPHLRACSLVVRVPAAPSRAPRSAPEGENRDRSELGSWASTGMRARMEGVLKNERSGAEGRTNPTLGDQGLCAGAQEVGSPNRPWLIPWLLSTSGNPAYPLKV
jgi:hypothetical protein